MLKRNIMIDVYKELYWQTFFCMSQFSFFGPPPHSPRKMAGAGLPGSGYNGAPEITSLYPGSPVFSFDLLSFWFSCVSIQVASPYIPLPCTVYFLGTKTSGDEVIQWFEYNPAATGVTSMTYAMTDAEKFKDVNRIKIFIRTDGAWKTLMLLLDDVHYAINFKDLKAAG